jgi:ssDNA-binding Zn-finger/Zn-ribbon topoisomerase 1
MVQKTGRYGSFNSCVRFPDCKGNRNLDGTTGRQSRPPAPSPPAYPTAAPAPVIVTAVPVPVVVPPQERVPNDTGGKQGRDKESFKLWKRVAAPVLGTVLAGVLLTKLVGGSGQSDHQPKPPEAVSAPATRPADPAPPQPPPAQQAAAPVCPKCGAPMKVKTGKYGKFWSCTRFPDCRGSRDFP